MSDGTNPIRLKPTCYWNNEHLHNAAFATVGCLTKNLLGVPACLFSQSNNFTHRTLTGAKELVLR